MQILGLEVLNIMKRFSIVLLVFLLPLNLFIIVGGCSEENELTEDTEMKQEEVGEGDQVIYNHGLYVVNAHIQPGRYRAEGLIEHFSILSCVEGALITRGLEYQLTEDELDCIIRIAMPMDRSFVIDIHSSDFIFETTGEGHWRLIDGSYQPEIKTVFTEGYWIVGLEIEPGTYHTNDKVHYWARLNGFRDEFEDIIDEERIDPNISSDEEGITVVIEPTDVGFYSHSRHENGISGIKWEKVD
jgi:hypothetical protein